MLASGPWFLFVNRTRLSLADAAGSAAQKHHENGQIDRRSPDKPGNRKLDGLPKEEDEHKPEARVYQRDASLPIWHGWHTFCHGLATNLRALGADDKTIQAILRHRNVGLTMNGYVKSVSESQVDAMDTLGEKLGTYNELATNRSKLVQ